MNLATIATYTSPPVSILIKKEKILTNIEREAGLDAFDRRMAVQEVNRALIAWQYQEQYQEWSRQCTTPTIREE